VACLKKKARAQDALIVFIDESGLTGTPPTTPTWAPAGCTPVVQHPGHWQKYSLAGALVYTATGRFKDLIFECIPGAYNGERFAGFVQQVLAELRGRRVILIWDNLSVHRAAPVRKVLTRRKRSVHVTRLPPYAPELNPVEYLWGYLDQHVLANRSVDNVSLLAERAAHEVIRLRNDTRKGADFLRQARLSLA
jgi:transposase